ncbi:hypothetical protein FXV83_40545 [Bradyrhizobium hipponense]|uniref:Uncharacterized protein n=1 Tax=Bradyrhizobium hipponense TaxID=2605638 RepID=A0A5S4YBD7_9BRAD|nr:hypothetical protein [Bradyrhizobium hipponense]TYO61004.1 hypothetical protein FXV83_40545 [Bradyrhizobium hipponense]
MRTALSAAIVAAVGMWATLSVAQAQLHVHSRIDGSVNALWTSRHRRAMTERLMRATGVVQRGLRTPTGPFFARFFIDIILGLVAEFAFMGPSTRLAMSPSAARWMDRKQIVGWRFQHGCSSERHALRRSFWQLSHLSA